MGLLHHPFWLNLLSSHFGIIFQFFKYFLWLKITDEGSIPEMRIWSISLIVSDLKWCIHISISLLCPSSVCLSVRLSVRLSHSHSYVSQATHAFLGMLPLFYCFKLYITVPQEPRCAIFRPVSQYHTYQLIHITRICYWIKVDMLKRGRRRHLLNNNIIIALCKVHHLI